MCMCTKGVKVSSNLHHFHTVDACIGFRNFPQGTISDMVDDVSQGISFICNNIAEYGGDPDR